MIPTNKQTIKNKQKDVITIHLVALISIVYDFIDSFDAKHDWLDRLLMPNKRLLTTNPHADVLFPWKTRDLQHSNVVFVLLNHPDRIYVRLFVILRIQIDNNIMKNFNIWFSFAISAEENELTINKLFYSYLSWGTVTVTRIHMYIKYNNRTRNHNICIIHFTGTKSRSP